MDKVRIYARGGCGGQGSSRIGGMGGAGGDVEVCAVEGTALSDIARMKTKRFVAGTGINSKRVMIHGKKGSGVVIKVPPGTVVYDQDEKQEVIRIFKIIHCMYVCEAIKGI